MESAHHIALGKAGEDAVCDLLASKGYAIVERNARIGRHEIDIVAMHGVRLVIVEVKTRTVGSGLSGLECITRTKMQSMVRAADVYVRARKMPFDVQFDICLVQTTPDGAVKDIEHIPDAFFPPF